MNYEDERIKSLQAEKNQSQAQSDAVYNDLLTNNQDLLNRQNSLQDEYLKNQNELYDRGLNLTTDKINQAKNDVNNAYQKEAMASEADYQKFINPYSVQAEQMAERGLSGSGYSESAKTSAYNTSRIRTALARSSADKAMVEYNNQIAEAQLNNDSQKAQLALQLLQQKLANELSAFQTTLGIKQNQLTSNQNLDNTYYSRYQDVFNQQKYEQERDIEAQRYAEQLAYQKEQDAYNRQQDALAQSNWQKEYNRAVSNDAYNRQQDALNEKNKYQVSTPYYQGDINPNTKYGTFETLSSNGVKYQPNNVGTYTYKEGTKTVTAVNTLSKAGVKVGDVNSNLRGNGGADVSQQNVWVDKTGKYWYWDGSINDYRRI
jgi:hypothetical protein